MQNTSPAQSRISCAQRSSLRSQGGIVIAELAILAVLVLLLILTTIRLFGGSILATEPTSSTESKIEPIEPSAEDSTIVEGGAITKKMGTKKTGTKKAGTKKTGSKTPKPSLKKAEKSTEQ